MLPDREQDVAGWLAGTRAEVAARLASFLADVAVDDAQHALLAAVVRASRRHHAPPDQLVPGVHLPLLAHAALSGDDEAALPLAVATTVLELGMDLLDHVQDDELDEAWADTDPALVVLAAVGCVASLPLLALARVDATPATANDLCTALGGALRVVGSGQQHDLAARDRADPAAALRATERIAERRALFCGLGARLAGADRATVAHLEAVGRGVGTARKLTSDLADLAAGAGSRDLRSGAATFPIAWAAHRDTAIAADLPAARHDASLRADVAARVLASGAHARTTLAVARALAGAREAAREGGVTPGSLLLDA